MKWGKYCILAGGITYFFEAGNDLAKGLGKGKMQGPTITRRNTYKKGRAISDPALPPWIKLPIAYFFSLLLALQRPTRLEPRRSMLVGSGTPVCGDGKFSLKTNL